MAGENARYGNQANAGQWRLLRCARKGRKRASQRRSFIFYHTLIFCHPFGLSPFEACIPVVTQLFKQIHFQANFKVSVGIVAEC